MRCIGLIKSAIKITEEKPTSTSDCFHYYKVKLVQANIYIAFDILTPRMRTNPGFMEVYLKIRSDNGLLLFSNLLSMTPGTLSVDIDSKKQMLLVHVLYNSDKEKTLEEIDNLQNRIKKIFD